MPQNDCWEGLAFSLLEAFGFSRKTLNPESALIRVILRNQARRSIILWPLGIFLTAMTRRHGNPNWGRPGGAIPAVVTEFECEIRRLGLTKETCASSHEFRRWCERNKNRCYIPEWLLEEWEIAVDPYFSGAA
jgi:hypothetical protein